MPELRRSGRLSVLLGGVVEFFRITLIEAPVLVYKGLLSHTSPKYEGAFREWCESKGFGTSRAKALLILIAHFAFGMLTVATILRLIFFYSTQAEAERTRLSVILLVCLLPFGLIWAVALAVIKLGGERLERFGRRFWPEFRKSGIAIPTWLLAAALGLALVVLACPALELAIPQLGRGYGFIGAAGGVIGLIWVSWAFAGAWKRVRLQPEDEIPQSPAAHE